MDIEKLKSKWVSVFNVYNHEPYKVNNVVIAAELLMIRINKIQIVSDTDSVLISLFPAIKEIYLKYNKELSENEIELTNENIIKDFIIKSKKFVSDNKEYMVSGQRSRIDWESEFTRTFIDIYIEDNF